MEILGVINTTRVLTKEYGSIPIEELENKEIHIWSGREWEKTKVIKNEVEQYIDVIYLKDKISYLRESNIMCTENYKFYLTGGSIKRAKDLKIGDRLVLFRLPDDKNFYRYEVTYISNIKGKHYTYHFTETKLNKYILNNVLVG